MNNWIDASKELMIKNKFGEIEIGTKVYFNVENPNTYYGPTKGTLEHNGTDFFILTEKGIMTIGQGYDAYINTIMPIKDGAYHD